MSGFLTRMAEASRERVRRARRLESEASLLSRALERPLPPALALGAFDVIAELKLRSPAAGGLASATLDLPTQVEAYARGGAAAVSVLTEPTEFEGDREHLRAAVAALEPLGCPVMRKDFLVDPYQVLEARADGAGGVLVIVTMLADDAVMELVQCARDVGLFVLLEAFDAADLARLAALVGRIAPACEGALLAGVNCRNLKTLEVDFARFAALAAELPRALPTVAESGIDDGAGIAAVAGLGYRLALVGSALMRAADPARAVAELVARGRAACGAAA